MSMLFLSNAFPVTNNEVSVVENSDHFWWNEFLLDDIQGYVDALLPSST